MSGYFQRLIDQSRLAIPPAPRRAIPPEAARASAVDAPDFAEIHEEHVTGADSSSAPSSPPPPSPASSRNEPPPQPSASPRDPGHRSEETTTILRETVMLSSGAESDRSTPGPEVPRETQPASHATSVPPASKPEIPPAVLQAVMKWIAADPASTHGEAAPATPPSPGQTSSTEAPISSVAAPVAHSSAKIPDRVIESAAEQLNAELPTPAASLAATPAPRALPPRTVAPSPDGPARVSIGSIQVRIEAPVPIPSAPAASNRPVAPARLATPARATSFSKLRRHYVIPH